MKSQSHQLKLQFSETDDRRNSDPPTPHLSLPYSDDINLDFSNQRFQGMSEIFATMISDRNETKMKKKKNKFVSFITNLFKSRSDKSESDQITASTSSPFWCPAAGSKSKSVPKFVGQRIPIQNHRVNNRGRSRASRHGEEEFSSRSSQSCEPTWKRTPLVRANPNHNWNWKTNSLAAVTGEGETALRKPSRAGVALTAEFVTYCKNKPKKVAEFGTDMEHWR